MKLRGIEFGPCWDAPGIRGWMGEGYWHHHLPLVKRWLKMKGSTLVSKTTTMQERIPPSSGNMPIEREPPWSPVEWFPKCIWVNLFDKRTVNAVGLSGPGAEALLGSGLIDRRLDGKPFQISFMSVAKTAQERLTEFRIFVSRLLYHLHRDVDFGLQVNISCPNTGLDPAHLVEEGVAMLDTALPLTVKGIPIIVKLNVLAPMDAVKEIAAHPNCDALCVSNALPFGTMSDRIPWTKLFPKGSPVKRRNPSYGEGGYSGPELLTLTGSFIYRAQVEGVTKPWNAGGGIRRACDVEYLVRIAGLERGRDSIFFASAAMVCPWNVPGIREEAHRLLA
jgi:dihydroorotate dehydrogenase